MTNFLETENLACHYSTPGGVVKALDGVSLAIAER